MGTHRSTGWWLGLLAAVPLLVSACSHPIAGEDSTVTAAIVGRDLTAMLKSAGASDVGFEYSQAPPGPDGKTGNVYVSTTNSDQTVRERLAAEAMVRSWLYLYRRRPDPPVRAINLSSSRKSVLYPVNVPMVCLYVTREQFGALLEQSVRAHGQPDVTEMAGKLHPSLKCLSFAAT